MLQSLKILLLQARRQDDPAQFNERKSFADRCGLALENIVPFDLLTHTPTLAQVQQYDALMVGGSGEFYVSKRNLPGFEKLVDLLGEVTAVSHPTFASCFGFQLLAYALGGEIIYDPGSMEVGTYPVTLTEAGRGDELFGTLPETFNAQLGRKDRVMHLPESALHLAGSERAPFQALRIDQKPIWATQFHPELTKSENLARFHRYVDGYVGVMTETEMKETLSGFQESPETATLMGHFLQVVFGS
ncbi:MAG: aminotransferase [Chloroflexi bacterium]|nr:MAG: aminotransferase [Chloroflexota bacterium]